MKPPCCILAGRAEPRALVMVEEGGACLPSRPRRAVVMGASESQPCLGDESRAAMGPEPILALSQVGSAGRQGAVVTLGPAGDGGGSLPPGPAVSPGLSSSPAPSGSGLTQQAGQH